MGARHPSFSRMKLRIPEMIGTWASEYGVPKSKGTDRPALRTTIAWSHTYRGAHAG